MMVWGGRGPVMFTLELPRSPPPRPGLWVKRPNTGRGRSSLGNSRLLLGVRDWG